MARKFIYQIHGNDEKFNLYVQAKPAFSLREMYAKQHNVLGRLIELPFVNITIASCREADTAYMIHTEPISSAFHFDRVNLDHIHKKIIITYDNVLEFVIGSKDELLVFLEWLKKIWLGEWEERRGR